MFEIEHSVELYIKRVGETNTENAFDVLFFDSGFGKATELGIVPPNSCNDREEVIKYLISTSSSVIAEALNALEVVCDDDDDESEEET